SMPGIRHDRKRVRGGQAPTRFPLGKGTKVRGMKPLPLLEVVRKGAAFPSGEPPAEDAVAFSTWPWEWVGASSIYKIYRFSTPPLPRTPTRTLTRSRSPNFL